MRQLDLPGRSSRRCPLLRALLVSLVLACSAVMEAVAQPLQPEADIPGPVVVAEPEVVNIDPWEPFNRKVHTFNTKFDDSIGRPIARAYVRYLPRPVRRSVGNFFNNLWEPSTTLNSLLQGMFDKAADSFGRFLINSTFGVFGLFDVANVWGLAPQNEDFGQTLAVWGVSDGPYLVLPFLGPSNVRDAFGIATEWYTTDLVPIIFHGTERWVVAGIRLLDARASVLGLDEALQFQVDPYLFLRESYRQSRNIQINEGAVRDTAEDELFEDELFEDELFGE